MSNELTARSEPGQVGELRTHTLNPLSRLLTIPYIWAQRILHLARGVEAFHMQSIHIARQALHLVVLLNDSIDEEEGPTDEQQDERIDLGDELIELEEAMRKWGAANGAHEECAERISVIKWHYARFFKTRFYFETSGDSDETLLQRLIEYDMKTLAFEQWKQSSATTMSKRGDEERGRGRTMEKDPPFLGRVRARSNSLTKTLSKAIQYPVYLAKGGSTRSNKQITANANGSNGALAYSNLGHRGRTSDEDAYDTPSLTTDSTATASTTASPISNRHHTIGNPSKLSVDFLLDQHQHTPTKPHKREIGHSPPQQYSIRAAGVPSAFQRLKKLPSAKELEQDLGPMRRAEDDVLQMRDGIDVNPRRSGVMAAQVQVSQSRSGQGVVLPLPRPEKEGGRERGERRGYAPVASIPFMIEQPAPRRRLPPPE